MKYTFFKLSSILFFSLLSGCDNSSNSKQNEVEEHFIPTNANTHYTGIRTLAAITQHNVKSFSDILFSDANFSTPTFNFAAKSHSTAQANDFLMSQEQMIGALLPTNPAQATIQTKAHTNTTTYCHNNGTIRATGDLDETIQKAKLNLTYSNCQIGNHLFNGHAYFLIFETHEDFNHVQAATLSFNNTQARHIETQVVEVLNGTVDKVHDYTTESTRFTTKLHRKNSTTGLETLTDVIRWYTFSNNGVVFKGDLYHQQHGKVSISTTDGQPFNYVNGNPIDGQLIFKGLHNSQAQLTVNAQGESWSLDAVVDENGDGTFH